MPTKANDRLPDPHQPLRVALYTRVSSHDQQTLPLQLEALRDYAARRGWVILQEVSEVGSGAVKRPQRDALLLAARFAFAALVVGYGSIALLDPPAARRDEVPAFFARLRPPQMAVALAGLVALLAWASRSG